MNWCNKNLRLWYLSGGMTKFGSDSYEESNKWREELKARIWEASDHTILCFNPNLHYSYQDDPNTFTDREAMDFDIYKLKNSELVIYNNNDPFSRGSMIELGIAHERNIPIIVIADCPAEELHPWVRCMTNKICQNIDEVMNYVYNHYIRID